jgi:hypothetical protein
VAAPATVKSSEYAPASTMTLQFSQVPLPSTLKYHPPKTNTGTHSERQPNAKPNAKLMAAAARTAITVTP